MTGEILTEDFMTWVLYQKAKAGGSKFFFKIKHNLSLERDWHYSFGPDVDLLEVRNDNTLVGYEIKGQRKMRTGEYDWPAFYNGLGQALHYLILPFATDSRGNRVFEGGAFDYVYLVNARPEPSRDEPGFKVLRLTPLGYVTVAPGSVVTELTKPTRNPLQTSEARQHVLSNLGTLAEFSEQSKTFHSLRSKFSPT